MCAAIDCIEEPAVAAGVHEPGEELGIVAVAGGLPQQPDDRSFRLADVCFEIGVELVRDREVRIEIEGAAKRLLGAGLAVGRALDVFPDDAMAPSDLGPGGRKTRIQVEALLVQVARSAEAVVRPRELVRSQIELVRARITRRCRGGRGCHAGQRQ